MTDKKPLFPMFFDISEKKITVVGAGTIAKRRIRTLLRFADDITVIAPELNPELEELKNAGYIKFKRGHFDEEDILSSDIVIAASTSSAENNAVHSLCRENGVMVNVASDKEKNDFFFPSVNVRGDVVVGVSSGGRDQKRSREIGRKISLALKDGV